MSLLTAEDISRVNQFYMYINRHHEDFINNALRALDTFFGYRLTSFLVFEKTNDHSIYVSDTGSNSINPVLLQQYKDYFYKKDPFLRDFKKKAHSSKSNCVFKLTDFQTMEEFSKTDFGRFLADYDLGYYVTITTGAIFAYPVFSMNIHRTSSEHDFSPREYELLEMIGKAFTESYGIYRRHTELKNTIQLICQYTDTLNYGAAIVDDADNVLTNNSTYILCASRITNQKDVHIINRELISLITQKIQTPLSGLTKNAEIELGGYQIKLIPTSAITDRNISRHTYINIYDPSQAGPTFAAHSKEYTNVPAKGGIADKGKFTNREVEIIELMLQGCNNQDIANKLYISIFTVKTHIKNIFNKLDVSTRMAAIAKLSEII